MMKIGLFGGTFNPIHCGHIDMAQQVFRNMALDKILLIPAYVPPHKTSDGMVLYEHRFAMVKLAIQGYPFLEVSDIESKLPKPSYTLQTVNFFRHYCPNDNFYYIMGADSFNHIESWYHWEELLSTVNIVVINRKDHDLHWSSNVKKVLEQSPYQCIHLPLDTLPISSTMIRKRLRDDDALKYLPSNIKTYIMEHGLYSNL